MRTLLLTFIPLFVAVDVVAVVLVYLGIGMPLDETAARRLVLEATMTAAAVGLGFLLVGDAILSFLGVSVGDFQVAGGVLLLVLSIHDLLHPELPLRQPGAHPGVVPLGIPMIVGPAVLTTLLTLARTHGYAMTLIAFALNLVIVWAALRWAAVIGRVLGEAGSRAITKVFSLVLAAIAVTFVRRGVMAAWTPP
ncbi:MAG TPA: MarC family protein [Candidatus Binatia bacterium]|nr:MarC family protein [Candidatus Binatia bacterium]